MEHQGTCRWVGASGADYPHYIYPVGTSFNEQDGNYIYAKKNARGQWVPIYIGEGDLAARSDLDQHHQGVCIRSKGATHFHCHANDSTEERLAEESDLLAGYPQAYKPRGCNEKLGG